MRRTAPLSLLVAPAILALGACATAPSSGFRTADRPTGRAADRLSSLPTTSRSSYVLAAAAIPPDRSLLDVVAACWPQLVRGALPRGETGRFDTIDRFGVYDTHGALLGGPSYLETMRAADIVELRRLTYGEEAARFGRGHPAGAVVVKWRSDAARR